MKYENTMDTCNKKVLYQGIYWGLFGMFFSARFDATWVLIPSLIAVSLVFGFIVDTLLSYSNALRKLHEKKDVA